MKISKLKFKIQKYLIAVILLFAAMPVFAAELFFEQEKNFGVKDQFKMSIFIQTKEPLNAIEGKITFPSDLLELKNIEEGNSTVSLWLERPKAIKSGEIIFSGITPGGYKGDKGLILSMIFLIKQEGAGIFEIGDTRALLNDGEGTEAKVKTFDSKFIVSKKTTEVQIPISKIKDADSPESFMPEIARDKTLFDGNWFVVFTTQDKGLGVDHYEIKESRQKVLSMFLKWIPVESPHVLQDQELKSYVWIKAADKSGNKKIVEIAPKNSLAWYENYENWIIIILGVFIIAFAARKLWKKRLA